VSLDGPDPAPRGRPAGGWRFANEEFDEVPAPAGPDSSAGRRERASAPTTGATAARRGGKKTAALPLAWLHHSWVGPLVIAAVLGLLGTGIYVLVAGRGGTGHGSAAGASASAAPVGTNAAARTGQALVDGTYTCLATAQGAATSAAGATTTATASGSANGGTSTVAADGVLVIPPQGGLYQYNGQIGEYTMSHTDFSDPTNIIGSVSFTTGPLQGQAASSIADFPASGGRPQATLSVTTSARMQCQLN
jgi:hypothetical protein